ncbi:MAG: hypothetical protein ABIP19_05505 [Dermatophilaceae bacterium]
MLGSVEKLENDPVVTVMLALAADVPARRMVKGQRIEILGVDHQADVYSNGWSSVDHSVEVSRGQCD